MDRHVTTSRTGWQANEGLLTAEEFAVYTYAQLRGLLAAFQSKARSTWNWPVATGRQIGTIVLDMVQRSITLPRSFRQDKARRTVSSLRSS